LCDDKLEPAQHLRYLVETESLGEPAYLASIRRLPSVGGRPLPVCGRCQRSIAANPVRFRAAVERRQLRAGVLTACGLLSVGLILSALLRGPRV
jgi:hypothetical protein